MRNRFKGLDLIDRVPDKLWTEVRDIVQETGIKTIPMEKKYKKAKWLPGEAPHTLETISLCSTFVTLFCICFVDKIICTLFKNILFISDIIGYLSFSV